jgi:hypothetical protein
VANRVDERLFHIESGPGDAPGDRRFVSPGGRRSGILDPGQRAGLDVLRADDGRPRDLASRVQLPGGVRLAVLAHDGSAGAVGGGDNFRGCDCFSDGRATTTLDVWARVVCTCLLLRQRPAPLAAQLHHA